MDDGISPPREFLHGDGTPRSGGEVVEEVHRLDLEGGDGPPGRHEGDGHVAGGVTDDDVAQLTSESFVLAGRRRR